MIPNAFLQKSGLEYCRLVSYPSGMLCNQLAITQCLPFLHGLGEAVTKVSVFVKTVSIPKVGLVPPLVLWHNLHNS